MSEREKRKPSNFFSISLSRFRHTVCHIGNNSCKKITLKKKRATIYTCRRWIERKNREKFWWEGERGITTTMSLDYYAFKMVNTCSDELSSLFFFSSSACNRSGQIKRWDLYVIIMKFGSLFLAPFVYLAVSWFIWAACVHALVNQQVREREIFQHTHTLISSACLLHLFCCVRISRMHAYA